MTFSSVTEGNCLQRFLVWVHYDIYHSNYQHHQREICQRIWAGGQSTISLWDQMCFAWYLWWSHIQHGLWWWLGCLHIFFLIMSIFFGIKLLMTRKNRINFLHDYFQVGLVGWHCSPPPSTQGSCTYFCHWPRVIRVQLKKMYESW